MQNFVKLKKNRKYEKLRNIKKMRSILVIVQSNNVFADIAEVESYRIIPKDWTHIYIIRDPRQIYTQKKYKKFSKKYFFE